MVIGIMPEPNAAVSLFIEGFPTWEGARQTIIDTQVDLIWLF